MIAMSVCAQTLVIDCWAAPLHQRSVFSPLLFAIVTQVISRELWGDLPWKLLYVDSLISNVLPVLNCKGYWKP